MYEHDEIMESLVNEVIGKHEDLKHLDEDGCRIACLSSDKKLKSAGRAVLANATKVPAKCRPFMDVDFIITFYTEFVNGMSKEQLELLAYHELRHIGYDSDGNCWIIPHDVEDFESIINGHGIHWAE